MTIPELLTTMTILGFVITGILAVYVGGLRATNDMNERFQAQQNARLALSSMRVEVGSSCSASVAAGGTSVTLGLWDSTNNVCSTTNLVTWCATSTSGVAPFSLYRQTGSTCTAATGVKRAGSLTTTAVFSKVTASGTRPGLQVNLPVDANLRQASGTYTLKDLITLRNAPVS